VSVDLFWWQVEIFGENVEDVLVDNECQFIGDHIEFVLRFEHLLNSLDTNETFVTSRIHPFGVEDGGCDDGREVGHVHARSSLFVAVRKRGNPFEEHKQNFHRVSVHAW
jgi:hypothetical protein